MHTEALLGGSNMYARPAWENTFMPSHAGFEQGQQEWDPLDPEYLAKIADPCGSPSISPIPNLEDKKSSNVQGVEPPCIIVEYHHLPSSEGSLLCIFVT